MHRFTARITALRLGSNGTPEARLDCPPGAAPAAGQYILSYAPDEPEAPLAEPLFLAEAAAGGFWASSPIPSSWRPGLELALRGPLGHGFCLPENARRVALAALGETFSRLLPLAWQASRSEQAVTLFTDLPLPALPSWLEVYPLGALPEALSWPDYLALDLPRELLPGLSTLLGLEDSHQLPCPTQALVWTPMPCGALAGCGACAVPARRGYKLACEDGPVFDLKALAW